MLITRPPANIFGYGLGVRVYAIGSSCRSPVKAVRDCGADVLVLFFGQGGCWSRREHMGGAARGRPRRYDLVSALLLLFLMNLVTIHL